MQTRYTHTYRFRFKLWFDLALCTCSIAKRQVAITNKAGVVLLAEELTEHPITLLVQDGNLLIGDHCDSVYYCGLRLSWKTAELRFLYYKRRDFYCLIYNKRNQRRTLIAALNLSRYPVSFSTERRNIAITYPCKPISNALCFQSYTQHS